MGGQMGGNPYGAPMGGQTGAYPAAPFPGATYGVTMGGTYGYTGGNTYGAPMGGQTGAYPAGPMGGVPPMGGPSSVTVSTTTTIPITLMPTFAYPPNNPRDDAHKLYKSMKGLGTDDSTLIQVMTNRSKQQFEQIQQVYTAEYHQTLEKQIRGDTSGNYCTLLCDLAKPRIPYKAESVRKAVKGIGTRESLLIDVLSQSSNAEIAAIKFAYPEIERDVGGDTSGNFRKVLARLLMGNRQEITVINDYQAEGVANELYRAGEFRLGTNDSKFVEIFTTYSAYFLDRVNYHYKRLYGHSIVTAIEKETSGDYRDVLIALTKPPDVYFADRLKQATKGLGTDDWGLIYIFAIHDKSQLKHIAQVYSSRGHGNLAYDLERDTSGNYRKTLLSLLS